MTKEDQIRKAKAEYAKRYRREHPDRVKAAQDRYWLKRANEADKRPSEIMTADE